MSDNESLEQFFNDLASEADGTLRRLRVTSAKNAVEGYQIANSEIISGGTSYYGFLDKDGNWYIQKAVESGKITTYTYVKGASDYATNWTGRTGLSYNTFDAIF